MRAFVLSFFNGGGDAFSNCLEEVFAFVLDLGIGSAPCPSLLIKACPIRLIQGLAFRKLLVHNAEEMLLIKLIESKSSTGRATARGQSCTTRKLVPEQATGTQRESRRR